MRCGGYSLVEVLVAMFVLAAGVLGAAGTQAVATRMRHDSDLMTAAVRLGATLAERMRANPSAAVAYVIDYDAGDGAGPTPPPARCFAGAACNPTQLAAFDIHDVSQALAASFPGGRIKVCRDAQPWNASRESLRWPCSDAAGAPYVIKIGWRERRSDTTSSRARDDAPRVALPVPE